MDMRKNIRRQRGMALLLVMIGMVVCTILTAGFLASQGTSLGIARNERDAQKCRVMAQTGVDMCYWLIRNRSDWRENMSTGKWLDGFPVGDGTVTVSATDAAGNSSFATDPSQGVVLTSTGSYDNRDFSLTATIKPTGGGTVFNSGNFMASKIVLGNTDQLTIATLDSYNSSIAPYNILTAGSNASFTSTSTANNTLTIYQPSVFKGSYTSAPSTTPSNTISLQGLLAGGPTATSSAAEARTPGSVITPNTTGLTYRGSGNITTSGTLSPGRYDNFAVSANVSMSNSGLYYTTGNMSVASSYILTINDGKDVVFMVDGNCTFNGRININGTGSCTIYCNGTFTVSSTNLNSNGTPSKMLILGTPNCTQVTITGTSAVYGAIYAPKASITLQTGSPKLYGGAVGDSLTIKNTARFHFDESLKTLKLSQITGGTASPGTADYRVTINSGPGLVR
jgi:Tfp pilus assembly protein PilX